jgi:hypothetical protein
MPSKPKKKYWGKLVSPTGHEMELFGLIGPFVAFRLNPAQDVKFLPEKEFDDRHSAWTEPDEE